MGGAVWAGPCGRQAASVVAAAIRVAPHRVCLACLISCDSDGREVSEVRVQAACDPGTQVTETGQAKQTPR